MKNSYTSLKFVVGKVIGLLVLFLGWGLLLRANPDVALAVSTIVIGYHMVDAVQKGWDKADAKD